MITTPGRLPDLSDDEQKQIYDKIFDDGKKMNQGTPIYDNVYQVFLHQFLTDF